MTDRAALHAVVRFLGWATVLNGMLYLALLAGVIAIAGKTGGQIDPAVAALVGGAVTLVTTPATALGTLLLGPTLARTTDEPTTVSAPPDATVTVEPPV